MILKNITRKIVLTEDLHIATSFKDQLLGLLQKRYTSMAFFTRFGIHTLGMSKNLDLLVLNNQGEVVKIKKNQKPNSLFFWNPKYPCVIELPAGIIEKKTKIGDKIVWQKK